MNEEDLEYERKCTRRFVERDRGDADFSAGKDTAVHKGAKATGVSSPILKVENIQEKGESYTASVMIRNQFMSLQ